MDATFFSHVHKDGPVLKAELGPCWTWDGQHHKQGYGQYTKYNKETKKRKSYLAHRYAYEQLIGTIPEGLVLDHLCRNVGCVNPYHTEPVIQAVNVLRGEGYAAKAARKTTCKRGHPLVACAYKVTKPRRYCPVCAKHFHKRGKRKVG